MNFCLDIALLFTFIAAPLLPRKFLLFLLPIYFFSGVLLSAELNLIPHLHINNSLKVLSLTQPDDLNQIFFNLCLIILSLKISTSLQLNNVTNLKSRNYKVFIMTYFLLEFLTLSIMAAFLFKIPWLEAFLFSFLVIAPLTLFKNSQNSPSIFSFYTIPWSQLISFVGVGLTLTLLSSSINDPISLLLVKCLVNLFFGIPLGHFIAKIIPYFSNSFSRHSFLFTLLIIGLALLMQKNALAEISFFLVPITLISFGYTLAKLEPNLNKVIADNLDIIWNPFLLILFFLVGFNFSPDILFGKIGFLCLLAITASLTIRFRSTLYFLKGDELSRKMKFLCSLSSLSKGEVQAALYGLTMILFFNSKLWLYNGAFITDLLNTATFISIVMTFPILIILNKFSDDK